MRVEHAMLMSISRPAIGGGITGVLRVVLGIWYPILDQEGVNS